MARAHAERDGELDGVLIGIERDLWVLMAELATAPENRHKLTDGHLAGHRADGGSARAADRRRTSPRYEAPTEFVVPGQEPVSARLDLARTVTRRAERSRGPRWPSRAREVVRYLNRLSDLLFVLARWQEGGWVAAKDVD